MPTPGRVHRLRSVLERRQDDLCLVLDNIHDTHNASAILRTCDGFGIGRIAFLYTDNPVPEIVAGVAARTEKWMRIAHYQHVQRCVDSLRGQHGRVLATHLDAGARSYLEVDWTQPAAIVFGNEHRGCSEEVLARADYAISVPMQGMAQSFNVSVAAGIILGELYRQRAARGLYAPSWSDGKERVYETWLARERSAP